MGGKVRVMLGAEDGTEAVNWGDGDEPAGRGEQAHTGKAQETVLPGAPEGMRCGPGNTLTEAPGALCWT